MPVTSENWHPDAMTPRVATCIALSLLLVGASAFAQESPKGEGADATAPVDSLWQMVLDPVVVTATRTERLDWNGAA